MKEEKGIEDVTLQNMIFDLFARPGQSTLSFEDMVLGLSIITRGSPEEKLDLAFHACDLNKDGNLTRDDLRPVMMSFSDLVGPVVTFSGQRFETADDMVEGFMTAMDPEQSGKITKTQYKTGAMTNPDIVRGLKLGK